MEQEKKSIGVSYKFSLAIKVIFWLLVVFTAPKSRIQQKCLLQVEVLPGGLQDYQAT